MEKKISQQNSLLLDFKNILVWIIMVSFETIRLLVLWFMVPIYIIIKKFGDTTEKRLEIIVLILEIYTWLSKRPLVGFLWDLELKSSIYLGFANPCDLVWFQKN